MEQMNQKISVIITVYNVEAYLSRAIESVLWQTYENLELILVDDGSTDGSGAICDQYQQKDSRIQVLHKENGGVSSARNAGLALATGDYIGFVDGDDWIERDMYYSLLHACNLYDAQIGICRYHQYEDEHMVTGGQKPPAYTTTAMDQETCLRAYLSEDPAYVIHHAVWNKLFARELIQDFQFPEGKVTEDILFTTWCFCQAKQFVYLDTPYYNYVTNRAGSIMNSNTAARRMEHEFPHTRRQIAFLKQQGMEELSDLAAYYFYRKQMFYYLEFYQGGKGIADRREGKRFAKALWKKLQAEKTQIYRLFKLPFAKTGDRVRMKLFLSHPFLYRITNRIYDKIMIPLRNAIGK